MKSLITADFTAINMNGNNSFIATYEIGSKKEVAEVVADFKSKCPFRKYDIECFAMHKNGRSLTKKEEGWFEELEISL